MVFRTSIIVVVAVLFCCSVQAQSLLLDKGERGAFLQGGYVGSENTNGGEFDLGYAFSDRFDWGLSIGFASVDFNYYFGSFSRTRTLIGQFADCYPVRFGLKPFTGALGLHEAAAFDTEGDGDVQASLGGSWNMLIQSSARSGIAITCGVLGTTASHVDEITFTGLIGLTPFVTTVSGSRIGIAFEYSSGGGSNTYAVGLTLGFAGSRSEP